MVKAFHEADIGVVLDVVYNHTCEGDHRGPIYSYKGFDCHQLLHDVLGSGKPLRQLLRDWQYLNFSQAHVRKIVMDSLRYWKREMHIDGFRFDLASVFSRNADGSLNWGEAPLFSEIAADPELGLSAFDRGTLGHGRISTWSRISGINLVAVEWAVSATTSAVSLRVTQAWFLT